MTACNRMSTCRERKLLLTGGAHEYTCDLLSYSERFGVLKYIVDRHYSVGSYQLHPGDVTIALYWTDRPYTLYTWHLGRLGRTLYYFNIADSVSLAPDLFTWRDLIVDILIDDSGAICVLDEQDLPPDIDLAIQATISTAKRLILGQHPSIRREIDRILSDLNRKP